jgi:magnesium-transporting ATPase (P-type)
MRIKQNISLVLIFISLICILIQCSKTEDKLVKEKEKEKEYIVQIFRQSRWGGISFNYLNLNDLIYLD